MPTIHRLENPLSNLDLEMTLDIQVYQVGDPAFPEAQLPDGRIQPQGFSLAELRKLLGGDVGELGDFTGKKHQVSLKQWVDADPNTTYVIIGFKYRADSDRLEDDPVLRAINDEESKRKPKK